MSHRIFAQAFVLMLAMTVGASAASAKDNKHHDKKAKPTTTAGHRLHDTTAAKHRVRTTTADRRRDERLGIYHRDTYVVDRNGHRYLLPKGCRPGSRDVRCRRG